MARPTLLHATAGAVGTLATWLATVTPESENKILRSLRARRGLLERFEQWQGRDKRRPLLWMHAPSVGEGLQAKPVLENVRRLRPDVQLAYTHFSPSAERFARSLDVDFVDYLPFDTARNARRAIRAMAPTAFVCAKLDLWPLFASVAASCDVQLGMISATLSGSSSRSGFLASRLLHSAYRLLDTVGAISADDADRLVQLGVRPDRIHVTGDTRFDQVWARAQRAAESARSFAHIASERPMLVAGSTWPADEAVLLAAWLQLRGRTHARLLIAPHEPTAGHLSAIEFWASANRVPYARLGSPEAHEAEVVIVDRVGVLGDLYSFGSAAFVGGGFHSAGLHSVLEPASFGLPIAFGPQHRSAREAGELISAGAAQSVSSISQLAATLRDWLETPVGRLEPGRAALAYVRAGVGAADRATNLVLDLLPSG